MNLSAAERQQVVDSYLKYLAKQGYKPKTLNRRCVSLNRFAKYVGIDIKAKSVKIQKKLFLNNILSSKDVMKMLHKCSNKRDRAIIITLYGTGIRVSELLTLTIDDVTRRSITIKGKYGKHREILLSSQVRKALKEYLEVRPKVKEKQLFIGRQGAITRQTVNNIINKYASKAYIAMSKAYPHSLRHLFCKRLSEQGIAIDIISSLAGHESLETTSIYTKRTKDELQDVLNKSFDIY